jgi:hypothetical protein
MHYERRRAFGVENSRVVWFIRRMGRGSPYCSLHFLTAAIVALSLYRLLESGFRLNQSTIFACGAYGAALVALPVAFSFVLGKLRAK